MNPSPPPTTAVPEQPAQRKLQPVSPHVKVMAGMMGGFAEAAALQPLDVTKTRLQLDNTGKYRGMVNCARTIVAEEGARALYKGLTPFITHLTLKYALRFGSFAWFQGQTQAVLGVGARADFLAGLSAGLVEAVIIVTPFEVVKTRLQKQHGLLNLHYRGPVHAAATIVREEGVLALWKGCAPTMVRQGTNQACNFMTYAAISKYAWGRQEGDGKKAEVWQTFLAGLVAGAVGPCLNCPMDVVKTRLMAQRTTPGEAAHYRGLLGTIRTVVQEEGLLTLWRGLTPRLMRIAPGQAITWTVVSKVTALFEKRQAS